MCTARNCKQRTLTRRSLSQLVAGASAMTRLSNVELTKKYCAAPRLFCAILLNRKSEAATATGRRTGGRERQLTSYKYTTLIIQAGYLL